MVMAEEEIKVIISPDCFILHIFLTLHIIIITIQQWKFGCDRKFSDSKENLATNQGNISSVDNTLVMLLVVWTLLPLTPIFYCLLGFKLLL